MPTQVEVEYCGTCGYVYQFQQLKDAVLAKYPDTDVTGRIGRRASFEVKVNGTLVHSKLNTMAFPDYSDLANIVKDVNNGKPPPASCKQQPITNCTIV